MTTTTTLIAKQTVGSGGASSVTFSDIPQTYTDLKVVISVRTTNTLYGETIRIKPNGLSTNGSAIIFRGYGSGISSYTYSNALATNNSLGNGATANTFASIEVYCPNYTSSDYKSFSADSVSENNDTNGRQELTASLWSSNAEITSLVFDNDASFGFTEFSTFYLYGISNSTTTQNATAPYALGGDVITTDGSYWYHAFKTSGSFVPQKNLNADILVVAGGGGGGQDSGGGGGAGGLLAFNSEVLTSATNYTCTIGAGGAGSQGYGTGGGGIGQTNGGNSKFGSLTTVLGGGYGAGIGIGSYPGTYTANSGGSGGGGSGGGGSGSGAAGTSGQGFAGGNGYSSGGGYPAGGGGGAGGAGQNYPNTSASGAGGIGATSAIINTMGAATNTGQLSSGNYYFAGGGGGWNGAATSGAGGLGGGGAGLGNRGDGTPNTGGGGGGGTSSSSNSAGYGGSGIIIVRYAV
jgi:hypothetical protein